MKKDTTPQEKELLTDCGGIQPDPVLPPPEEEDTVCSGIQYIEEEIGPAGPDR